MFVPVHVKFMFKRPRINIYRTLIEGKKFLFEKSMDKVRDERITPSPTQMYKVPCCSQQLLSNRSKCASSKSLYSTRYTLNYRNNRLTRQNHRCKRSRETPVTNPLPSSSVNLCPTNT
ncbi:uncharacterized protein LOC143143505 [Ptiloglossa arizonensis]|uniref:uncharacterized protein LOC143143505 n=1 Tax=Ptiloglossa arizonensis TaxID=3350558 RepID=UPI003FA0EBA5